MKLYHAPPEIKILYGTLRYIAGTKPIRSQEWLDRIRWMDCARCGGRAPSDPHHIYGSYGSMKTSDIYTIPLCRDCHCKVGEKMECFIEVLAMWFRIHDKWIREKNTI